MYSYNPYYETYLAHHGIKGMRWGVRRYQNRDGSLTSKGQKHRDVREGRNSGENSSQKHRTLFYGTRKKQLIKDFKKENKGKYSRKELKKKAKEYAKGEINKNYKVSTPQKAISKGLDILDTVKDTAAIAIPAAALASATYGGYKLKKEGVPGLSAMASQAKMHASKRLIKNAGKVAVSGLIAGAVLKEATKIEDNYHHNRDVKDTQYKK